VSQINTVHFPAIKGEIFSQAVKLLLFLNRDTGAARNEYNGDKSQHGCQIATMLPKAYFYSNHFDSFPIILSQKNILKLN